MKFIISLIISFVSIVSSAQTLTLQDAIAKGLSNNFQIRIAENNKEIAQRNNNWLEAGILPSLSFSASQGFNQNDQQNPASVINGKFNSSNQRVAGDLNWTLFQGLSVLVSKERFALIEEQSNESALMVIENTLQGISLAYLNALAQQKQLKAAKLLLNISEDQYKRTNARKTLGAAGTFELIQAENAFLQDSTNYLNQRATYEQAIRDLQLLIGEEANTYIELTDIAEESFPVFDKQKLTNGLNNNNHNLRQQFLNIELAENSIKQARSGLFPTINASAGANRTLNEFNFDGNSASGSQNSFYIQFALNYNIFNNLKVHRAIKNAKQNSVIATLTAEELKLNLSHNLDKNYANYNARLAIKNISEKTLSNALTQLNMATERLKSGAIDSFDFRQIQTNYLSANAQYYLAVFQTMDSYLELLKLSGGLLQQSAN